MFQFFNDIIKLPAEKREIFNKKNGSFAEKIALFDCKIWPKFHCKNAHSLLNQQRMVGNEFYRNLQFDKAIVAYNVCLLLSTLEFRGIAYANRAAAYLALGSYQDCLDSANLAKQYPLPRNTMIKVLAREKMAIEGLQIEKVAINMENTDLPSPSDQQLKLSYRRNKRMPSFAFCLKLKDAGNPYAGIITTENLLAGDVLVVEPTLTTHNKLNPLCDYCAGTSGSLQLCRCAKIVFCSSKCEEKAFEEYHKFECPLMDHLFAFPNQDCVVLRVFFKLITRFKDFGNLRNFVENIKNPNPFDDEHFEAWSDPGSFLSQFRIYYALQRPSVINCTVRKRNLFRTDIENTNMQASMAKTAIIIEMLKTCKQIPRIASSALEWSFLSELLFHFIIFKSFTVMNLPIREITYIQVDENGIELQGYEKYGFFFYGLLGSASLFRTSCQENICMDYVNNMVIVRALKYIPRGTELLAPQL